MLPFPMVRLFPVIQTDGWWSRYEMFTLPCGQTLACDSDRWLVVMVLGVTLLCARTLHLPFKTENVVTRQYFKVLRGNRPTWQLSHMRQSHMTVIRGNSNKRQSYVTPVLCGNIPTCESPMRQQSYMAIVLHDNSPTWTYSFMIIVLRGHSPL